MKLEEKLATLITFSITALLIAGCTRTSTEPGSKEDKAKAEITQSEKILKTAGKAYEAGNTNKAIKVLLEGLIDEEIKLEEKPALFNNLLRLQAMSGLTEDAEKIYFAHAEKSPDMATAGYQALVNSDKARESSEYLFSFLAKVIARPDISESLKHRAFTLKAKTLYLAGDIDKALATVKEHSETLQEPLTVQLCRAFLSATVNSRKVDDIEKVMQSIAVILPENETIKMINSVAEIDILFIQKDYKKAQKQLKNLIKASDDANVSGLASRAYRIMNSDSKAADALSLQIIKQAGNVPNSARLASHKYVKNASNKPSEIVKRIERINKSKVNSRVVFSIFNSHFYTVLNSGDKKLLNDMQDVCTKLRSDDSLDGYTESLILKALDLAFMAEDYDSAIKLIEAGIPDRDDAWHKSAIVKMKAHSAENKGDIEEAIKHYRAFMDFVAKDDNKEADPSTKILHTREMMLAKNAMRIGRLHSSIKQKDEAAKAYKEAEELYNKAKISVGDDKAALALIEKEAAQLKKLVESLSADS